MPSFDPWRDAQHLAQHLRRADAELLVVIGAESWCAKCRRLKPAFESLCASLPDQAAWMWLDLEEHGDFLAGFVPPDLPVLLRWRAGECVQAAVVQDLNAEEPVDQRVRLQPLVDEDGTALIEEDLPDLWAEFSKPGWASE